MPYLKNDLLLLVKAHNLYDATCGLQYLHGQEKPIIHCDITAKNVLLNTNFEAKIADLRLAKVTETNKKLSAASGNICHMPLEAIADYNKNFDVFSFGCVTIHTITEKFPIPIITL